MEASDVIAPHGWDFFFPFTWSRVFFPFYWIEDYSSYKLVFLIYIYTHTHNIYVQWKGLLYLPCFFGSERQQGMKEKLDP